jgi:lysine 2,3-aminomutase
LRRQFLPLASELRPDHPRLRLDSLCERADAPVSGLTHRYPDRALLLALDTCPVYCRFCTRSYAVGMDTEVLDKDKLGASRDRWESAFAYIAAHRELEDVVISGGDLYQLRPDELRHIGDRLLAIPHVRRIRLATRGLAVMPMRILSDPAWLSAVVDVVHRSRALHKQVAIHTHFNHAREITAISKRALDLLLELGITVRSQTVLLRGVNDDAQSMKTLVKRLGYVNVHPYYVYQHDMVAGVEDLRTPLSTTIALEKEIRGATTGFNTPSFVVDLPEGGGKRQIHSFEHYDRVTGISVWRSPNVDPHREYVYFDPIDQLPARGRLRWASPDQHVAMVEDALAAARTSSPTTGWS